MPPIDRTEMTAGNQDLPLDPHALRDLVEGTGAQTGEAFFEA